MDNISISQLKVNPSKAIAESLDYPVAVANRNKVQAYLIGRKLFEKIISYIEDFIDRQAVKDTDFSKGKDLEKVIKELKI